MVDCYGHSAAASKQQSVPGQATAAGCLHCCRLARDQVAAEGLTNLTFQNPGLEEEGLPSEPTFDLVMTHDAIHDMARPDKVIPHVHKVGGMADWKSGASLTCAAFSSAATIAWPAALNRALDLQCGRGVTLQTLMPQQLFLSGASGSAFLPFHC